MKRAAGGSIMADPDELDAKASGWSVQAHHTTGGENEPLDEFEEYEEDGPLDLEDQLERALDRAFPPKQIQSDAVGGRSSVFSLT